MSPSPVPSIPTKVFSFSNLVSLLVFHENDINSKNIIETGYNSTKTVSLASSVIISAVLNIY